MRRPAVTRVLPVVGWLPRYERRWLGGDLAADHIYGNVHRAVEAQLHV